MPSSPEGRYILCKERAVEVVCKPESEEACRTQGNISIAREIKVDIEWLEQSDFVVAEVSTPSLGVGFEIATACHLKKKILCLVKDKKASTLSAMISGCPGLQTFVYSDISEAKEAIYKFLQYKNN